MEGLEHFAVKTRPDLMPGGIGVAAENAHIIRY
jgi:hypothetical protein